MVGFGIALATAAVAASKAIIVGEILVATGTALGTVYAISESIAEKEERRALEAKVKSEDEEEG